MTDRSGRAADRPLVVLNMPGRYLVQAARSVVLGVLFIGAAAGLLGILLDSFWGGPFAHALTFYGLRVTFFAAILMPFAALATATFGAVRLPSPHVPESEG